MAPGGIPALGIRGLSVLRDTPHAVVAAAALIAWPHCSSRDSPPAERLSVSLFGC